MVATAYIQAFEKTAGTLETELGRVQAGQGPEIPAALGRAASLLSQLSDTLQDLDDLDQAHRLDPFERATLMRMRAHHDNLGMRLERAQASAREHTQGFAGAGQPSHGLAPAAAGDRGLLQDQTMLMDRQNEDLRGALDQSRLTEALADDVLLEVHRQGEVIQHATDTAESVLDTVHSSLRNLRCINIRQSCNSIMLWVIAGVLLVVILALAFFFFALPYLKSLKNK